MTVRNKKDQGSLVSWSPSVPLPDLRNRVRWRGLSWDFSLDCLFIILQKVCLSCCLLFWFRREENLIDYPRETLEKETSCIISPRLLFRLESKGRRDLFFSSRLLYTFCLFLSLFILFPFVPSSSLASSTKFLRQSSHLWSLSWNIHILKTSCSLRVALLRCHLLSYILSHRKTRWHKTVRKGRGPEECTFLLSLQELNRSIEAKEDRSLSHLLLLELVLHQWSTDIL